MKYVTCCNNCGKERYGDKNVGNGITVHEGICPFCKKKKWLIPDLDWAGLGD